MLNFVIGHGFLGVLGRKAMRKWRVRLTELKISEWLDHLEARETKAFQPFQIWLGDCDDCSTIITTGTYPL